LRGKGRREARVFLARPVFERVEFGGGQAARRCTRWRHRQRAQLGDVLQRRGQCCRRRAEAGVRRGDRRRRVKARQRRGERGEVSGAQFAALTDVVEPRRLGKAPHLHRRLAVEVDDLEIELRREAPVEAQLGGARGAALFRRAVVEKGQDDGLLDLPGEVVGEQHPRGVGLHELDASAAERRARGIKQCPQQRRQGGLGLGHAGHYGRPRLPRQYSQCLWSGYGQFIRFIIARGLGYAA
jgi:hypothetical protein